MSEEPCMCGTDFTCMADQHDRPHWTGTVLESCIRDVALGRIAAHSSVTEEMVAEWKRLNPGRLP